MNTTCSQLISKLAISPTQDLTLKRSGYASLALLMHTLLAQGRNVAWVVQNREELSLARSVMTLFSPDMSKADLEYIDFKQRLWTTLPPNTGRTANRSGFAERLAALYALHYGKTKGLLLTLDNLYLKHVPLHFFKGQELNLTVGEEISPDSLLEQAIAWGYERVGMVSNPGEIARRGDILDIAPPGYSKPLRLDFFGDLLEEIRLFDPQTQRSQQSLKEALLLPVSPIRSDQQDKILARFKRLFQKGLLTENENFGLTRLLEQQDFRLQPGCAYDSASRLEEWLPPDTIWIFPGRLDTRESLKNIDLAWQETFAEYDEASRPQPLRLAQRDGWQTIQDLHQDLKFGPTLYAEPLIMGLDSQDMDLNERTLNSFKDLFPTASEQERPWTTLIEALKTWQSQKDQTILSFSSERSRSKFLSLAEQDGLVAHLRYTPTMQGLFALISPFRLGSSFGNSLILGEDILQPESGKARRHAKTNFKGLSRYDELKVNDLLVHKDYGIGRFGGLFRLDLHGTANDFLLLTYAGDDRLYLPVDRLSLIQRFKGDDTPPLDKLGTSAWAASKDKAQKAIEKIAEDLVEMYAWRKVAKGFTYPPLGELYREFEASFGFEETPDQAKAIEDVLADMEKPIPMDRLVCGDVGFGKTEVALRAAFRAASEGKQVALLCPTTILAEQHYQTFRARLANFAINVGLLSRFVSPRKQQETLKAAKLGQVDILIGTHRILSDDVQLPNLSLLILDEEQRFGVRHKEQLKKLKKNVDALTLTATPIPRTLQLSMSGVRELSVIETAPLERKPVATAILNRDKEPLRKILRQELDRDGQIFWVHNRVQGLDEVIRFVHELIPEAKIGMAHGQMPEKALETTMHKFWHGELDVLVCTAIVESGLDFPKANTLIVDGAQMFGLGQLYQLRGRVGRSDRQAFAGFVVADINKVSDITRERLKIILELDYLGAGMQVAMEDLRLRGAGNILGEVQSGHMTRLGLDLYLEMLEEAVQKIKGQGAQQHIETELNLKVPAFIPDAYIPDSHERLRWYKMLSSAPDAATREELELELRDRFGIIPENLANFLSILNLKQFLGQTYALKADIYLDRVRIYWNEKHTTLNLEKLITYLATHKGQAKLLPPATLDMYLDLKLSTPQRYQALQTELGKLL